MTCETLSNVPAVKQTHVELAFKKQLVPLGMRPTYGCRTPLPLPAAPVHVCGFVAAVIAVCLGDPAGASVPRDNATPEQLAQYAAELRRYINMLTRPRYGKRDKEETPLNSLEWGAPNKVAPRELSQMDE
ncbi:hypothetical protein QTO34_009080 [Cnephaeus nilssonii]|uniref:Pancreatic polypeptide n=1 Tax=Cnephaeus nilssonii TaxID=3371016 RepID=A0AA40HI59_CNENI|nr:hypothetical protein QTO34_009080 [Eptesicus nilssonii]